MYDIIPVISERATDCGPTCLHMLLAYYGQDVPLETLAAECGVDIAGCSASDLLRVGRAHGQDMTAWRMSADELLRQDRPGIIHWRFVHWCVFCGLDNNGLPVICNPDRGRYHIGESDFRRFYSGYCVFSGTPYPLDQFAEDYFGEHAPEPAYFDE